MHPRRRRGCNRTRRIKECDGRGEKEKKKNFEEERLCSVPLREGQGGCHGPVHHGYSSFLLLAKAHAHALARFNLSFSTEYLESDCAQHVGPTPGLVSSHVLA